MVLFYPIHFENSGMLPRGSEIHSYLSASTGSRSEARLAGYRPKNKPTAAEKTVARIMASRDTFGARSTSLAEAIAPTSEDSPHPKIMPITPPSILSNDDSAKN